MKRFWRFLTRPVVSVADALGLGAVCIAADAMHLGLRLPWGWVLAIVWAGTIAAVFAIGFVKGFARTAAGDWKRWRASRGSP